MVPRWRAMMLPATALLAAEHLHAKALAAGVAAVAGRSACFFVSHDLVPKLATLIPRFRDGIISQILMIAANCKPAGATILRFGRPFVTFSFPSPRALPWPWPPASWRASWLGFWPSACPRRRRLRPAWPSLRASASGPWSAWRRRSGSREIRISDEFLPVAALAPRILAAALLEGDDLRRRGPARAPRPRRWRPRRSASRAAACRRPA